MICPNCHGEVSEGKKFCGKCGASVAAPITPFAQPASLEIRCPKCGKSVKAGKKFCGSCGTPLPAQRIQTAQPELVSRPRVIPTAAAPAPSSPVPVVVQGPSASRAAVAAALKDYPDVRASTAPVQLAAPAVPKTYRKPITVRVVAAIISGLILLVASAAWTVVGVRLDLTTVPGGTEATLDGKAAGRTTNRGGVLVLPHLARGRHQLYLVHPGFQDWSQPIHLGMLELSHSLTARLDPVSFPLTVLTNPPGSRVQIDGADAGVSNQNGELVVSKVTQGPHVITVLHDGYPSWTRNARIAAPASVQADLAAAAITARQEATMHLQRAQSLFQQRQYQSAITECDAALQLNPSLREAQELKSRVQQTMAILGGH